MTVTLNRRDFLAASLGCLTATVADAAAPPREGLLDIHVHLFGVGEGGTGCRMHRRVTNSLVFNGLVWRLGLRRRGKPLDSEYERVLVEHIKGSGLKAAIIGQDAVYDRHGKADWDRTPWYLPNDYLFDVVARHGDLMLPCPGLNPDRADATDELERCKKKGARLFKVHPPTQGVDLADRKKHQKFFRRVKDLGMVMLVHTGHEHSAPVIDKELANPKRLEFALDEGCTVVACHAGTGWEIDEPDQLPEFLTLLKRHPNLWGDSSILATSGRVRDFGRLLKEPLARSRLLHGSDFPFPSSPNSFSSQIGKKVASRINFERSWLKIDYELKHALGVGRANARKAYQMATQGKVD